MGQPFQESRPGADPGRRHLGSGHPEIVLTPIHCASVQNFARTLFALESGRGQTCRFLQDVRLRTRPEPPLRLHLSCNEDIISRDPPSHETQRRLDQSSTRHKRCVISSSSQASCSCSGFLFLFSARLLSTLLSISRLNFTEQISLRGAVCAEQK